jgi:hypothetical protein
MGLRAIEVSELEGTFAFRGVLMRCMAVKHHPQEGEMHKCTTNWI